MSSTTYNPSKTDWAVASQGVNLFTNIRHQVIEFVCFVGSVINITSKIDNTVLEQQIYVTRIPVIPYKLNGCETIKDLSITVECLANDEYIATFEEAEISFSGSTITKAIDALKYEIIEVFKLFKSAEKLGPRPKRQLYILEKYIVQKSR